MADLPPILSYVIEGVLLATFDKNLQVNATLDNPSPDDEKILDTCPARDGSGTWVLSDVTTDGGTSTIRKIDPATGTILATINAAVKLGTDDAPKQLFDYGCGKILTIERSSGQLVTVRVETIIDSLTPGTVVKVTSLVRSGSTVTVTTAAPHGFTTGQGVRIEGADPDDYNDTFAITVTGSTTFTFTISGTPTTPATGNITAVIDDEDPVNDTSLGQVVDRFSLTLDYLDGAMNSAGDRIAYCDGPNLKLFSFTDDAIVKTIKTFPTDVCWPCWLGDDTFVVMQKNGFGSFSVLGSYGFITRIDTTGKVLKVIPPSDEVSRQFSDGGANGMLVALDSSPCIQAEDTGRGMIWLAGDHDPGDSGDVDDGLGDATFDDGLVIWPIKLSTGEVLSPIWPNIGTDDDFDTYGSFRMADAGSEYGGGTGDFDAGLPPKPDVHCDPTNAPSFVSPSAGCNPGGRGWVPTYTGPSGVVPEVTDPSAPETLTGKDSIVIDVSLNHTKYPSGSVQNIQLALIELDDTNSLKEGRIQSIGDVSSGMSDGQGNIEASRLDVYISDTDGRPFGKLIKSTDGRYFSRDELLVRARSDEGRRSGSTPVMIGRGLITDESYGNAVTMRATATDPIFIEGGAFDPDKKVPQWNYPLSFYTGAPKDLGSKFMPIIFGEVSDEGAEDTNGEPSAKGKCPIQFVGFDGLGTGPGGSPEVWGRFNICLMASDLVVSLYGSDLGGLGVYGRHASSDGKPKSTITLPAGVDLSSIPTNGYAQIVLFTPQGRSEQRIIGKGANSVKVNAQVDSSSVADVNWYISLIDYIPRRVKIDLNTRNGVDVMVPKWPGYVRSTPYEDFRTPEGDAFRVTDMWAIGPLLDAHQSGEATMTVNMRGIEDKGNASGVLVNAYFTAMNLFIDNFVHRQEQHPPVESGGDFFWPQVNGDLPVFADGITKTKQSSFAKCQEITRKKLGGIGLEISAYLSEGISTRDAMQLFNDNAGCRTVIDEYGRIGVWLPDPDDDPSLWPRVEHVSRVYGDISRRRALDEIRNVMVGGCDWDPEFEKFREELNPAIMSQPAITRNKGIKKSSKHIDGKLIAKKDQFVSVLNGMLTANQDGPVYITIDNGDLGLLDYPIGSGILLTSIQGPGDEDEGYVDHPMYILRRTFHINDNSVSLLCLEAGDDLVNGEATNFRPFKFTNDAPFPVFTNDLTKTPRMR